MKNYLSYGDKNADVLQLQQDYRRLGYGLKCDGIFGRETRDTTYHFQQTYGLIEDGKAGVQVHTQLAKLLGGRDAEAKAGDAQRPKTAAPTPPNFIEHVIKIAEGYEGVRETKENRGPHIDQWLAELGIDFAAPWCMAFVQGCFRQAALELGIDDPLKPDTAGVLDLWNRVPKSWRVGKADGRRGDIMILDFGGGKGHTGIVLDVRGGMYITIEGNTNDAGGRDGDCVAEKYRKKYSNPKLKGFVRVPVEGL